MTTRVDIVSEPTGAVAPEPVVAPAAPVEGLDPQFKGDPLALQKSYKELQAELTRLKQGKGLPSGDANAGAPPAPEGTNIPDPAAAEKAAAEAKAAEDKAAEEAAAKSGVDLNPYQDEFNQTGDVKPESRDAIAKSLEALLGKDARTIVDQYIDGRKVSFGNEQAAIKGAAGGDEAYKTMVSWAASALTSDEIAVYNQQVNSGNRTTATFAVEALRSRFEKANGREPRHYKGTFTPPSGSIEGYASSAQMTNDMKDPKYKTDPAFRERVRRRIAASQF